MLNGTGVKETLHVDAEMMRMLGGGFMLTEVAGFLCVPALVLTRSHKRMARRVDVRTDGA